MSRRIGIAVFVVAVAAVAPAAAQTSAPAAQGRSENLSSKLSKSDGVITPQENVDPGIKAKAPAPQPNSTPVIPPSATGGNTAK